MNNRMGQVWEALVKRITDRGNSKYKNWERENHAVSKEQKDDLYGRSKEGRK